MAIPISIRDLLEGKTVAASRLNASLVAELMSESLLVPIIHGARKSYRARDLRGLRQYLVDKDEDYRVLVTSAGDGSSRAAQAYATGNSKLVSVRSCPGFPVNTYDAICCRLNSEEFILHPSVGSFIFVTDWRRFEVPTDVMIVGIENMENFRMIRQQRDLFESELDKRRILFVSRYPQSTDLRSWLQSIPNDYIHFGDFDLAGIHIFLSEFHKYLGNRASYFIPKDIEDRLCNGSVERYNDQYFRFSSLSTSIESLQNLIDLIHKYRRCYDQEGYIVS